MTLKPHACYTCCPNFQLSSLSRLLCSRLSVLRMVTCGRKFLARVGGPYCNLVVLSILSLMGRHVEQWLASFASCKPSQMVDPINSVFCTIAFWSLAFGRTRATFQMHSEQRNSQEATDCSLLTMHRLLKPIRHLHGCKLQSSSCVCPSMHRSLSHS